MYHLTINTSTCNNPCKCEALICENTLPGIQKYLEKRGHFKISNNFYKRKKDIINKIIQSCPKGSITITAAISEK